MTTSATDIRQYALVTGNYWAFTLTDGALRMLVVLHFNQLGYSTLQIATLFLFYELFGVITNLFGGYLGARIGLNRTMNIGLALQIAALFMLSVPSAFLTVPWVMAAQALSGTAKDLNKLSAKSAIKFLVSGDQQNRLFKWIAFLTGSKNALKGVGFFLGSALLITIGFTSAMVAMAIVLAVIWLVSLFLLKKELGKSSNKPKFTTLFSKSKSINILSAARLFLFGARDIWFVVALPVYLSSQLQWSSAEIGGFLASWVIGYGIVQSLAPKLIGIKKESAPNARTALVWALCLAGFTIGIASLLSTTLSPAVVIITGLVIFGIIFAINSAVHSYLIVSYARADGASLDVGFYYMANALGRLIGTLLSGWIYQSAGIGACLWASAIFVSIAAIASFLLPSAQGSRS